MAHAKPQNRPNHSLIKNTKKMKTTFKKVMPLHYIINFNSMWYELYIHLDFNGKYSCYFFNEYFESNSENEIKKLVKNLLIENSKN